MRVEDPIVLVHGLAATPRLGFVDYFFGIPKFLESNKNEVFQPSLGVWDSIEKRAGRLKEFIQEKLEGRPFHLLAHSMGGLDCRYLGNDKHVSSQIKTITTIGTPHHGSALANILLNPLPKRLMRCDWLKALRQLRAEKVDQKDIAEKKLKTNPAIQYFSVSTVIQKPVYKSALPLFWLPHKILDQIEGPNDGFVSLKSSQFGNHVTTEYGDHYAQIGQFFGKTRGMDHFSLYRKIIRRLMKEGF